MGITQTIGQTSEELVCLYLQRHGLRLVQRNFRCRMGEIDLIMWDANNLVFVEVRCRHNTKFGNAAESITSSKRARLVRSSYYYLQQQGLGEKVACRFDVCTVSLRQTEPTIEWIKAAFSAL